MINQKKRTKLVEKIDLDVKRISLHLEITYNPKPRKNIKRETQEKYFTTQPKEILTQRIKHKF
jgi:hypothetical protein